MCQRLESRRNEPNGMEFNSHERSFIQVYKNKQLSKTWVGLRWLNNITQEKRKDSGFCWLEAKYESTASRCCLTKQKIKPKGDLKPEKQNFSIWSKVKEHFYFSFPCQPVPREQNTLPGIRLSRGSIKAQGSRRRGQDSASPKSSPMKNVCRNGKYNC